MIAVLSYHQDLAQVAQRYLVLRSRVSGLAGVSGGALQRVMRLAAEAKDLLDKASSSKRKLEGEWGACCRGHSPPFQPSLAPASPCLPPLGKSHPVPQGRRGW